MDTVSRQRRRLDQDRPERLVTKNRGPAGVRRPVDRLPAAERPGRIHLGGEWLQDAIERVVLLPVRLRHRRGFRAKLRARTQAVQTTRRTLEVARQLNSQNINTIFNVALYVLLLDQDLAEFTDDLVCSIGARRRAFLAKHEAVLLYEAAEDLPQLLGRDFRQAVKTLGASEAQLARLSTVSSELSSFWQLHREFLGEIRNVLVAHREHDALEYVERLALLKPLEVMGRAAELSGHLERLIKVLTDLASLTVGPAAVLHDIRQSPMRRRPG